MAKLFINIFKGILYGVFSVVPGLSGGILANYFGDYTKCIEIILGEKPILSNLEYLFSIFLGFILGVLVSSNIISFLYNQYTGLFILFVILCNLYILFRTLLSIKPKLVFILISASISMLLIIFFSNRIFITKENIFLGCIVPSMLYSFSKVVPGISSTSILINIGFYDILMSFFINPIAVFLRNPFFWFFFWIIFIIVSYVFLKIVNKLIKSKFFEYFIVIILIFNLLSLILKCCI